MLKHGLSQIRSILFLFNSWISSDILPSMKKERLGHWATEVFSLSGLGDITQTFQVWRFDSVELATGAVPTSWFLPFLTGVESVISDLRRVSPSGPPMLIYWVLDFKAIRWSSKFLGTSFSSPISPHLCFQDKCLLPCRGLFFLSLKNALAPGLSVSDSVFVNFFILSGMRY